MRKAYWNAFTLWHVRDEGRFPYRSREEVLAIQNRRIKAIVAHAYNTVPYYRQVIDEAGLRPRDFRTADDLAALPVHTGVQLARDPTRFRSSRYADRPAVTLQSTGTTGHVKRVTYDPAALFISLAHGHRQRLVIARFVGRKFGYREMDTVRSAGTSVTLRNFYDAHSWTPHGVDLKRSILSVEASLESNIARINAFKPDVIRGSASYIGALFRHAYERRLPLSPPKVVSYGADRLSAVDRELIESQFGARVTSTYQAIEALHIAFQCELCQGFHISLDDVVVRVVDVNDKAVGPGGTGDIVISNLTNRATVLLNYKLGDVVTLSSSACSCGRTLPTLRGIEGRSDDLIARSDGLVVHPLVVMQGILAVPGVVQMQLVQESLQHFTLHVVCADQVEWPQARRHLDGVLRRLLADDIVLDLERVAMIAPERGGKVRTVISRCAPKAMNA